MSDILVNVLQVTFLVLLIICAVSVALIKNNLVSVVVFMSYSCIMSLVWILLGAPDLAITEAAVGAGITSMLFFVTLKRIGQVDSSLNTVNKEEKEVTYEKE